MTRLKAPLILNDAQLSRYEQLYRRYRQLYLDPENCSPMFLIGAPLEDCPPWEEILADPYVMLQYGLDNIRNHLLLEDDAVPTVRVEFGTAQVAAAFGCDLVIPPNNLPAAGTHVLRWAEDVYRLQKPSLTAGWYGKLKQFTEIFLENLPEGVFIQHPDIQSPFNTAHLIRGNDIFTDFYDHPEELEALLDLVTDYMLDLIPYLRRMINAPPDWFFDWGALWKGAARLSNCSMHMIRPQFYRQYVMPRDIRILQSIGGGRMHYCGSSGEVIDAFFQVPYNHGLDYDAQYHDLWNLARRAPPQVTLLHWGNLSDRAIQRMLNGEFPPKRNIIVQVFVSSLEEGREVLQKLRRAADAL